MIKHFLDIDDLNKNELRTILSISKKIKNKPEKSASLLKKKYLGLIFEKKSLRTRLSFAIGMQKLGGNVIELGSQQIGFGKRESAKDILNVMSQYIDVLMIRNNNHKQLKQLAALNALPIINGLSDRSHPCQILSDIFTIEEFLGKIENQVISWMGDFNNVLYSLIQAAEILEFKLNILVPDALGKAEKKILKNKNLKYSNFYNSIEKGLKNSDCIMTDAWISMGDKSIKNKKKLLKKFQVNDNVMKYAKKNAIFMHCLPAHRNEEVTDSVLDGKQSVVLKQAKNRMFVQQGILLFLLNDAKI
jgi:ornithine carbamoyltransferase